MQKLDKQTAEPTQKCVTKPFNNILELIGNTPLLNLKRLKHQNKK